MTIVKGPEPTRQQASARRAQDPRPATERLREQANEVTKDLQEMGNIASDAVQESLGQIRDNASECYEQGRNQVCRAEHTFKQFISDRPLKSIMIAAGVGLLLGRFWRRR